MIISLSSCKSDLKNGSNDSPIESFSNEVDSISPSIKNNPVEQNEKIAENAELSTQLSPIKKILNGLTPLNLGLKSTPSNCMKALKVAKRGIIAMKGNLKKLLPIILEKLLK